MASFRLFPVLYQFTDDDGAILAGGSLTFSLSGGSTPTSVYGESGLSTDNGAVLTLGSDGRAQVDIWGDAAITYRVIVKDADDAQIGLVDFIAAPVRAAWSFPIPQTATMAMF
jgi:hypothetical protein